MVKKIDKQAKRQKRHLRIRNKISGTESRPRLCVYKSLNGIHAQIIDDTKATTLVSASTLDKDIKIKKSNMEAAKEVGASIAKKAIAKGIKEVVFDRSGYIYHGKIKSFAEAAREAGLVF